jgi:hypothetical protein
VLLRQRPSRCANPHHPRRSLRLLHLSSDAS